MKQLRAFAVSTIVATVHIVAIRAENAYVASTAAITAIDTATDAIVATILLPSTDRRDIAASQDGRKIYVTGKPNLLHVIDTATNTLETTTNIGFIPAMIAMVPSRSEIYTVNWDCSVSVIGTATNAVIATIKPPGEFLGRTQFFSGVASPDGAFVYLVVGIAGGNFIWAINTKTKEIANRYPLNTFPGSNMVFSPDGAIVYAISASGLSLYNSSDWTDNSTIALRPRLSLKQDTQRAGCNLVISSDGATVYATDNNRLYVVDTSMKHPIRTVPAEQGSGSYGLSLSHDGAKLYIAEGDQSVRSIDTNTLTPSKSIKINRASMSTMVVTSTGSH